MSDPISACLAALCGGSSDSNQNTQYGNEPKPRPQISAQEASNMNLNDFIYRTLESSPSVMYNRNEFAGIYSNLLAHNNPNAGSLAKQIEDIVGRLSSNENDRATTSWAIQMIGMAIDFNQGGQGQVISTPYQAPPPAAQSYGPRPSNNNQNNNDVYVNAYFFPSEDSFQKLISLLKNARRTLDICVFSITDDDIKYAIIDAKNRGVAIRIISDDDQAKGLGADVFELRDEHGIPVRLDNRSSYMHNKFCVADRNLVLSGSYNWTKNARKNNQENFIITNSRPAVDSFSREFEKLWTLFQNQ
ncbi:Mitochondrial cardiolipin hydrolase [Zancudomyces culisetae]|uniref:Mitochondrial cardiolipin hydrolase n=1 Tax=Zancudomyces culisetae TaxID=1213189 RepID=A0A1R1PWA2_ZANCU|nr:Mitochondrial cardiolipin hydrolase [Zancudomyces culisetae]|eukprot:OMH85250.1 Mitochondrial cardiolipin hydrolase [Zancudomyces culisetae]